MEGGPLSDPEFASFGKDVVLFAHVTSRIEGDKDQELLREKGGRGFPTLLFLDGDGEILAQQGDRSVAGFKQTAAKLKDLTALAEKTDRSADEEVRYFLARVALGRLKLAEAQEIAKSLPSEPASEGKVADALLGLEIDEVMATVRDQESATAAGARFAEMAAQDRAPKEGMVAARFWMMVAQHAMQKENVDLFEKSFNGVKAALGDDERYSRLFEQMAEDLAKLKG